MPDYAKLEPPEYDWAYQAFDVTNNNAWHRGEVKNMAADVSDWGTLTEAERQTVAGILRGFSLIEQCVGGYWRRLPDRLPINRPEITAMCTAFAYQESVHAYAYSYLESTLGLDTFEAFTANPACTDKLEAFSKVSRPIGESLALYSAFGEGVSLFGAFAVLLSICKQGKLKGMQSILSWSVRDERIHSAAGIKLAKVLNEIPSQETCYRMAELVVDNEISFLADCECKGFDDFVRYRADYVLGQLGYSPIYNVNCDEILEWFELATEGTIYQDFFADDSNGSSYTKTAPDFSLDFSSF